MAGANSWRVQVTGADWMRDVEKRILHEERRPNVRTAADLMGPGIAPYSVLVNDWNAEETTFNGFFHSDPGALHSPRTDGYWMGSSQATAEGYGLQKVTEYRGGTTDTAWPGRTWVRKFFTPPGSQRQFSAWAQVY